MTNTPIAATEGGLLPPWIVWSNEHRAFWAPARRGYTQRIEKAGRYTQAEAEEICRGANYRANSTINVGTPPEICMPAPEALDLLTRTPAPSLGEDVVERVEQVLSKARAQNPHEQFSDEAACWNEGFCDAWATARAALSSMRPVQEEGVGEDGLRVRLQSLIIEGERDLKDDDEILADIRAALAHPEASPPSLEPVFDDNGKITNAPPSEPVDPTIVAREVERLKAAIIAAESPPSLGVEELTGAVERVTEAFNDMRDGGSTPDTEQELLDHLPTVLRGVSTLREALEPFACLAVADDRMDGLDPDQLRASVAKARAALSRVSGGV